MRLNKKGEGGFMESIVVMMVVIVALTAFLAILPSAFNDDKDQDTIPTGFLNGISIEDSEICCSTDIEKTMRDGGFSAMRLVIITIGIDGTYELFFGERNSDDMTYTSGTILIDAGGRKINAEYNLAVWR